jgi:hypothetical protein
MNHLKMIRGPSPDPRDDDDNLIALLYDDEPEARNPDATATQNAHTQAGNARPFMTNFSGEYLQGTNDTCNGPGDDPDNGCYHGYIAAEDWVSHDTYPVFLYGGDLSILGRSFDKLRRWAHGKPMFG